MLGLLAAGAYGASDFVAGIGSRRSSSGAVALLAQPMGLIAALVALLLWPAEPPGAGVLWWGVLSGVGGGLGTVMLYQGLAVGRMGVISPVSAVLTALIPVTVGLVTGTRPSVTVLVGLALALPGIALVSGHGTGGRRSSGVTYALLAGAGLGTMMVALDRAGTASGPWPLVPGQAVSLVVVAPIVLWWARGDGVPWRAAGTSALTAGALGGTANLLFLAATGGGELAVVAVLTSLYPAVTVLFARALLHEPWQRAQQVGLAVSTAAVVLITIG